MSKVKTSISIEKELFEEISKMSTEQDRSFSKQISHLAKKGKEAVCQADLEKIRAELVTE